MKRIILGLIVLNLGLSSLNAQITIRENDVVEKAIVKPRKFDSLSNITVQMRPEEYKKYIGYKLFYLPRSKNYKPKYSTDDEERIIGSLFSNDTIQITKGRKKISTNIYMPLFYPERTGIYGRTIYETVGSCPDSIYGRYFTIIDIKGKAYDTDPEYKKLEDIDFEPSRYWHLCLKIILRNESNQDTLYWVVGQARWLETTPFFLVPYFEKQRDLYLNKNLVLRYGDRHRADMQDLVDVNTGATINIKYGEVWTCSDVSFVDSKDSYYLKGFYFLKNGDREFKTELGRGFVESYFMLETEFKKRELEKQKKEEERQREQQERDKKEQQERIKFKNDCIAKWGQKMGAYIAAGKVVLGMNKEMCTAAWGSPIDINSTIVRGLTSEQWVYGWGTYLYFDNGILRAIQN